MNMSKTAFLKRAVNCHYVRTGADVLGAGVPMNWVPGSMENTGLRDVEERASRIFVKNINSFL